MCWFSWQKIVIIMSTIQVTTAFYDEKFTHEKKEEIPVFRTVNNATTCEKITYLHVIVTQKS